MTAPRAFGLLALTLAAVGPARADDWIPLFNGKDLTGWKIPDPPSDKFTAVTTKTNADCKPIAFVGTTKDGAEVTLWKVEDGLLIGGGPASHIFSDVVAEDFKYRVEVKINDGGNSGQYFRTEFGPGFPKGYEAQVNATHKDAVKSGSLYPAGPLAKFRDKITVLNDAPIKPDEFYTQEVVAVGNHITIAVNGKQTVDFVDEGNTFSKGHFALQGHDPGSVMTFKKVEYQPLKK